MTLLTLTEVLGEPREWSPKDHPERKFYSYRVKASDGSTYEINTKGDPPKLGPDDFTITPGKGDFPAKLKRQFGGGGGGGQNHSHGSDLPPEFWAAKDRRLARAGMMQAVVASGLCNNAPGVDAFVSQADHYTTALLKVLDQRAPSPNNPDSVLNGSGLGGGDTGSPSSAVGTPAAEPSAGRKGATSRRLTEAGIADRDTQKAIVAAFGGPTDASLDAIDAAVANHDWSTLFDEHGIPRPSDLPDTRDLAAVIPDDSTIL